MADSFAIYRLPRQAEVVLLYGTARSLDSFGLLQGAQGFVIAPFQLAPATPLVLISPTEQHTFASPDAIPTAEIRQTDDLSRRNSTDIPLADANRQSYARDFALFHRQLCQGRFRKLVLARQATASGASAMEMFCRACQLYPRMFVSLFSSPFSGTWLVATPEILLESRGQQWHTMALAGTMKLEGDALAFDTPAQPSSYLQPIMWSEKNIQEQRYVASFIHHTISSLGSNIVEDGPRTVRAGNLVHLRSDFLFTASPEAIPQILEALHPTPAVCGLPKLPAWQFIARHEHSPRLYYSGFAGPLSLNGSSHLFVSLRCMNIGARQCHLYAGGGLLQDSDETEEWNETEAKMETMKRVIECTATKRT